MLLEDGFEDFNGVKNHLQRIRDAGDDEVAFLPRAVDPKSFEDGRPLMLARKDPEAGWMLAGVSV
jgi:hypothetical protein